MTRIGLPVPDGFTITTEACLALPARRERRPAGPATSRSPSTWPTLEERVGQAARRPQRPAAGVGALGRACLDAGDDGHDPQPGAERRVGRRGWPRRAATSGSRSTPTAASSRCSATWSLGVDGHLFEDALTAAEAGRRRAAPTSTSTPADLARAGGASSRTIYRPRPASPSRRTRGCSSARRSRPCSSRGTRRARVTYRRAVPHRRRPRHRGQRPADGVRQHGRRLARPASPSRATRRPASRELYGEFLRNAQGEDVVAGIRTPQPLAELEPVDAARPSAQLARRHARCSSATTGDMQDIEFTIERGTLYMLQTRTGKRTAAAAVRIARDMVDEGVIDRATRRCGRIDPDQLDQLLHPTIDPRAERDGDRQRPATPRRARRSARSCSTPTRPRARGKDGRGR